MTKNYYFRNKNEDSSCRKEITSPSGRYKLIIRSYYTGKGSWNYTRGTVFRLYDGYEVCDIKRNYSTFTHSFVIKDGQEYLITGSTYLTQTIINLDTGVQYDNKKDISEYNFCWAEHFLSPDEKTLVVIGCVWACPYEIRFYDFSDLSNGWPELKILDQNGKDSYIDAYSCSVDDAKCFAFSDDETIKVFRNEDFFVPLNKYRDDMTEEEIDKWLAGEYGSDKDSLFTFVVVETKTLKRDSNTMKIINVEKSDWLLELEKKYAQEQKEMNDEMQAWKENSDLYNKLKELCETSRRKLNLYFSYPSKNDRDTGETNEAYFQTFFKINDKRQYELKWGVTSGDIELNVWKYGVGTKFVATFPRSIDSIERAFKVIH